MLAVAARSEQSGSAHHPQMLRSIGDRQSDPFGERFDASLALRELFENFKSMSMCERLGDFGESRENRALRFGA